MSARLLCKTEFRKIFTAVTHSVGDGNHGRSINVYVRLKEKDKT